MTKYEVRVRYTFEGIYKVVAEDRNEAKRMVTEGCGLVLGGNIHTTLDDDEIPDWKFGSHPDMQILSVSGRKRNGTQEYTAMNFSGRIEKLREDIIDAIRQQLYAHGLTRITFSNEQDDYVWIIWFGKNGDPYECQVTGLEVTDSSLTVQAIEKESGEEVFCHSLYDFGANNIDWLHEMYEAVCLQLEDMATNEKYDHK